VPLRFLAVLRATLTVTVPLPVPLAPPVMVIHESSLVALQVQVPAVETVTLRTPPLSSTFRVSGATT
jgi:hypothetical protein